MIKKLIFFLTTTFQVLFLLLILLMFVYSIVNSIVLSIPSDDISVEILISNQKYQIGDTGIITIEIHNQTSIDISPSVVDISLPTNFLSGFIVDYPVSCSLHQGVQGLGQKISCSEVVVPANEKISLAFSIVPYQEGNYGGTISAKVTFTKGLFTKKSITSTTLNISVLPK